MRPHEGHHGICPGSYTTLLLPWQMAAPPSTLAPSCTFTEEGFSGQTLLLCWPWSLHGAGARRHPLRCPASRRQPSWSSPLGQPRPHCGDHPRDAPRHRQRQRGQQKLPPPRRAEERGRRHGGCAPAHLRQRGRPTAVRVGQ